MANDNGGQKPDERDEFTIRERDDDGRGEGKPEPGKRGSKPNHWNLLLIALAMVALAAIIMSSSGESVSIIRYDTFLQELERGNVREVTFIGQNEAQGRFKERPEAPPEYNKAGELERPKDSDGNPLKLHLNFSVRLGQLSDNERERIAAAIKTHDVQQKYDPPSDAMLRVMMFLMIAVPIVVLIVFFIMMRRTRDQLMGGGFLSGFSKSTAKRFEPDKKVTTFNDVAGLSGVKDDLQELVDFLKDPERFQRLGGRVPKGVLLMGPPGTGKTLLARAVAGEAGVPFFSVNGSEFIQMFVGVGASRVRDLFQTAKQAGPAIIFIDEIDAVGRQRGAGLGGGHDEREQTLNQILSEMDGFAINDTVIVLAATNRPDVLDPALLRPGRFDRHITVDRPTLKGRIEIFKVHVRDIPLDDDVDLERLAAGSVGLTGADIRNLCNEAALWATRQGKNRVFMDDFEYARDKILMGAKREEVLLGKEKEAVAYHEAGHALLAWLTPGAERVHKVTVVPRGRAMGVTQILPEEDRLNIHERDLHDRLAFLLGGRAAEKLIYKQCSAGAENDLDRATRMARRMVTQWGMSERLGPVSYKLSDEDPFLGREMHQQRQFSEHTMQVIDEEVARILHDAADRALHTLEKNRDKLETLANALVEREELTDADIAELIGPSANDKLHVNGQPAGETVKQLET